MSAAKYLSCTGNASISGSFSLKVQHLKVEGLHAWSKQDEGKKFSGSLTWQTVVTASVEVKAKTTCTPGPQLRKLAAKWVIAGIAVSVRPDFSLSIDASAEVTASQTTTETLKITGTLGLHAPSVSHTDAPQPPVVTASGKATFDALIGGDATITAGIISVEFDLLGGVHVAASATGGQVCADGYPEVYLTGTISASVWKWHPELTFLKLKPNPYPIKSVAGHSATFHQCVAEPPPCTPHIDTVSTFHSGSTPDVTVDGTCFGVAPATSDTVVAYLAVTDITANWQGCWSNPDGTNPNSVGCSIPAWTDTAATFSEYGSGYGQGDETSTWLVQPGDRIRLTIWNSRAPGRSASCTVVADQPGPTTCGVAG